MISSSHRSICCWFVIASFLPTTLADVQHDYLRGKCIDIFNISDVISATIAPPHGHPFFGDGKIPAHLQYVMFLDQSDVVVPSTNRRRSWMMQELSTVLSRGDFYSEGGGAKQRMDRCQDWTWVWNMKHWKTRYIPIPLTGRMNFVLSHVIGLCSIIFEWNDDYTSAVLVGGDSRPFRALGTARMDLMPFWAWKFGLPHDEGDLSGLEDLDTKCCPQRPDGPNCTGEGVLGLPDAPCETISMACGVPSTNDIPDCAMWIRRGPSTYEYLIYPMGDKNKVPSGFFPRFEEAMEEVGIEEVFKGHESLSCPEGEG